MNSNKQKINRASVNTLIHPNSRICDSEIVGFRARKFESGKISFEYRYSLGGKEQQIAIGALGDVTPEEARKIAKKYAGQVASGISPLVEKNASRLKERANISLSRLVDLYLTEGKVSKPTKRESSWETDASNLRSHVVRLLGSKKIFELKSSDFEKLYHNVSKMKTPIKATSRKLRGRTIINGGNGTAKRTIDVARAMFNWAIAKEYTSHNPVKNIVTIPLQPRERLLSDSEVEKIVRCIEELQSSDKINEMHADIYRLIILTGARSSEIIKLERSEIDFQNGFLNISRGRHKNGTRSTIRVTIPLNDFAINILKKYDGDGTFVFRQLKDDKPISKPKNVLEKIREASGIGDFSLHTFRHTHASHLANSNVPLPMVQKSMGHAKISTTMLYVKSDAKLMREIVNKSNNARFANIFSKTKNEIIQVEKNDKAPMPSDKEQVNSVNQKCSFKINYSSYENSNQTINSI